MFLFRRVPLSCSCNCYLYLDDGTPYTSELTLHTGGHSLHYSYSLHIRIILYTLRGHFFFIPYTLLPLTPVQSVFKVLTRFRTGTLSFVPTPTSVSNRITNHTHSHTTTYVAHYLGPYLASQLLLEFRR